MIPMRIQNVNTQVGMRSVNPTMPEQDTLTKDEQVVVEHRKLLRQVHSHQVAMKTFKLDDMDKAAAQQEAMRLRIAKLESQRRSIVAQIAKTNRIDGELTVTRLATLFPQRGPALL